MSKRRIDSCNGDEADRGLHRLREDVQVLINIPTLGIIGNYQRKFSSKTSSHGQMSRGSLFIMSSKITIKSSCDHHINNIVSKSSSRVGAVEKSIISIRKRVIS